MEKAKPADEVLAERRRPPLSLRPRVLRGDDAQQLPDARAPALKPGKQRERQVQREARVHVPQVLESPRPPVQLHGVRHRLETGHGLVEGEVTARHQGGQGLDAEGARLDLAFAHRLAEKLGGQRIPAPAVLTQGPVAVGGQLRTVKHVPLRGDQADGEVTH